MYVCRLSDVIDGAHGIRMVMDRERPWVGQWVISYDPDAYGGLGEAEFGSDPARAAQFASFRDAADYWSQRSVVSPTVTRYRPGGVDRFEIPNTPLLLGFSCAVDELTAELRAAALAPAGISETG
jgi:hypothetical protein